MSSGCGSVGKPASAGRPDDALWRLVKTAKARIRANPGYRLVPLQTLAAAECAELATLAGPTEPYGLLQPRPGSDLPPKTVRRRVADLFHTASCPRPLAETLESLPAAQIASLLLDDVLRVEDRGGFVGGPELYGRARDRTAIKGGPGALSRLSLEALQYAQLLDTMAVGPLAARLYFYNRYPVSPVWRRRFPNEDSVAEYLDLPALGEPTAASAAWRQSRPNRFNQGWLTWRLRSSRAPVSGGPTYKLYVSPQVLALRPAFRAVVDLLPESGAVSFKVGRDVYGILRSDKLAVYFRTYDELRQMADRLAGRISDLPAHGVPFSAELAAAGLLSWGMDPTLREKGHGWTPRLSWRTWVTTRLAASLALARRCTSTRRRPWEFALFRLRCEGVDPRTWLPPRKLWEAQPRAE